MAHISCCGKAAYLCKLEQEADNQMDSTEKRREQKEQFAYSSASEENSSSSSSSNSRITIEIRFTCLVKDFFSASCCSCLAKITCQPTSCFPLFRFSSAIGSFALVLLMAPAKRRAHYANLCSSCSIPAAG